MSVCLIIFTVDVFSTLFLAKNQFLTIFLNNDFSLKKIYVLNPIHIKLSSQKPLVGFSGRKHKKSDNFVAFGRIWKTDSKNGGLFSWIFVDLMRVITEFPNYFRYILNSKNNSL